MCAAGKHFIGRFKSQYSAETIPQSERRLTRAQRQTSQPIVGSSIQTKCCPAYVRSSPCSTVINLALDKQVQPRHRKFHTWSSTEVNNSRFHTCLPRKVMVSYYVFCFIIAQSTTKATVTSSCCQIQKCETSHLQRWFCHEKAPANQLSFEILPHDFQSQTQCVTSADQVVRQKSRYQWCRSVCTCLLWVKHGSHDILCRC